MRILIADDHPIFTQGLRLLLSELDNTIECTIAANLHCALALTGPFDLLLLDLHMPDTHGLDGLLRIMAKFDGVPVIVLSSEENTTVIRQMMAHGAAGFIPKSSTPAVLVAALRLILDGGTYLPPEAFDSLPQSAKKPVTMTNNLKQPCDLGLTQRQREVFTLLAQGKSNKIIARELGLSEGTVKTHISTAFRVLNVNNRTQALCKASQLGFTASVDSA
jgi:DNA-binding NarL/FixJ family response regulator